MAELRAAYRLQLLPHLDFAAAQALVPYLRDLGVSHLYLAPSLQARAGSTHGYDVVDPTRISAHLGGEEGLRALAGAGLALILDVVPNHMAASEEENPFWRDRLVRAKFFDVEWREGGVRRFFDVSDLAGVRVEDPEVFEATHAPFKGFNRAQNAVIETAILASRLKMLPRDKIERELAYLQIAVEKTAGPREHEAWRLLVEKIEDHYKHHA